MPRTIRSLFIANRGEIAARIARTAAAVGIRAVAAHAADPELDLLDPGAVVSAALAAGADALHPGYGFLSENPSFAEAVEDAGLTWVGPPASAIRAMGDKAAARRLAASLEVPVVPGYDGADQADETLAREAEAIGYPVLVKPAGGGGGKGMRAVLSGEALPEALAAARREAKGAFGDERLLLERLLRGPRHVEVQVLFDGHGNGIDLGERDCSLQRRHQKVLEETPSPAVDSELRHRLSAAALLLAGAVGYVSAGTVEFLVDDEGRHYFLEMNTRLQVEHPVTELVKGRDIVADQLRIAEGATLDATLGGTAPWAPSIPDPRFGHAVEVRLYAEDPEAGFLPSTGQVAKLQWPSSSEIPNLRIDAGIEPGAVVGGRFDPLLGKIIVGGRDRADAFDRLAEALDRTVVLGLVTNLRFLRWLVRLPDVRAGEARIDTIEQQWTPEAARLEIPDDAWAEAATLLLDSRAVPGDPWTGGWRMNAPPSARLVSGDEERSVALTGPSGDGGDPGRPAVVVDGLAHLDIEGRSVAFGLAPAPEVEHAVRIASRGHGSRSEVVAPMPGSVLAVHRSDGDVVEAGDAIATLEAMKMEHVVGAPGNGRIAEILVRQGDQIARGQLVALLEESE